MKRISAALAASLLLLGCSKKGPECEQTVATLNPGVDALNKAMSLPEEKPEDAVAQAQAVGKAADEAATSFAKLSLTTPELQKFVADYRALLAEVSTAAKAQEGAAMSYVDVNKKVEALPKRLSAAFDKLIKSCETTTSPAELKECAAVSQHIKDAPTDFADAEKLKAYAASVRKFDAKVDYVKTGLADLATSYENFATATSDAKSADAKLKAAEEHESAAIKKQNASVDVLNAFCAH